MWLLQYNLNGTYGQSKWQTQKGAIADRERMLAKKPAGWTAIRKIEQKGNL